MRKTLLLILTVMLVTACGTPERPVDETGPRPRYEPERYRAVGFVLDEKVAGPVLCLGTVDTSLPPQCNGLPVAGWDWDAVSGEESAGGVTWGTFEVMGRYDGRTFTVFSAGAPPEPPKGGDSIKAACSEPSDGDPNLLSEGDRLAAIRAAERSPDFAGAWIDYIGEPSEFTDPEDTILSLAFAGDPEGYEEEIRERWGGPSVLQNSGSRLSALSRLKGSYRESGDATSVSRFSSPT